MGPEKPGIFSCNGTVGRCHFLGSWLAQKEHRYDRGGRGRRQQRGTDHITQQKIHYIMQINSRDNFIVCICNRLHVHRITLLGKEFSVCNDFGANNTGAFFDAFLHDCAKLRFSAGHFGRKEKTQQLHNNFPRKRRREFPERAIITQYCMLHPRLATTPFACTFSTGTGNFYSLRITAD